MLGAVDAVKRPLQIPSKFIPYLEKHRIYELFHEIAVQLVIKKPSDHILYMKQCLRHAEKCRDMPKVILFAPPDFDKYILAEYLEKKLGICLITLQDISTSNLTEDNLANNVRNILRKHYFHNESSWIFLDFPRNKLEARALQRIGILPTHVIEIVWTVVPSDCSSTTHKTVKSQESVRNQHGNTDKFKNCDNYNLRIFGLREAYANLLITVETGGRTFEELGNACITLIKKRKNYVRSIFRIILIGSRGSGRRCVANHLSHTYGLIHIDFNYLLQQVKQQRSPLGDKLRCIERQWDILPQPDIRIKVVENKLMSRECIMKGWVLTGYPITVEDFKLLDLLTTPPNRIIFLNVNQMVCRERLLTRRFNQITGSEHHLPVHDHFQTYDGHGLFIHPKDDKSTVEQDLQEYQDNIEELLKYAGESVDVVDGMGDKRVVCERVDACLAQIITCEVPRISKLSKNIDPMEIEYDPDDEVDLQNFDEIRTRESMLSLV